MQKIKKLTGRVSLMLSARLQKDTSSTLRRSISTGRLTTVVQAEVEAFEGEIVLQKQVRDEEAEANEREQGSEVRPSAAGAVSLRCE